MNPVAAFREMWRRQYSGGIVECKLPEVRDDNAQAKALIAALASKWPIGSEFVHLGLRCAVVGHKAPLWIEGWGRISSHEEPTLIAQYVGADGVVRELEFRGVALLEAILLGRMLTKA